MRTVLSAVCASGCGFLLAHCLYLWGGFLFGGDPGLRELLLYLFVCPLSALLCAILLAVLATSHPFIYAFRVYLIAGAALGEATGLRSLRDHSIVPDLDEALRSFRSTYDLSTDLESLWFSANTDAAVFVVGFLGMNLGPTLGLCALLTEVIWPKVEN